MDLLTRTLLLFLISCTAITLQNSENSQQNDKHEKNFSSSRDRRAIYARRRVGPIRQIFGLIFEQWNDSKVTYNMINDMLNENFLPENATTTTTTPNPNLNVSTKAPPFRITRNELARILRRNLKGLYRLYNLEMEDALKQSRITEREFNKNVSREVSKFL